MEIFDIGPSRVNSDIPSLPPNLPESIKTEYKSMKLNPPESTVKSLQLLTIWSRETFPAYRDISVPFPGPFREWRIQTAGFCLPPPPLLAPQAPQPDGHLGNQKTSSQKTNCFPGRFFGYWLSGTFRDPFRDIGRRVSGTFPCRYIHTF